MLPEQAIEEARRNPLAYYALAVERPIHSMHRRLVGQLTNPADTYNELPRGHGKTTGCEVILSWMLGNWPSLRVKIVGPDDPEAAKTAKMLRATIESPLFRAVFPSVRIKPDDKASSTWSLTAARPGLRDSTVEARGVFAVAGGRWDILWLDDIANLRNSILIPAERSKVKEAVTTNWLAMRDIANPGPLPSRVWKTATPYHTDDITADWRREHGASGTMLRCPCSEKDGRRVSPWPEGFGSDELDRQFTSMGPLAYARAYGLVPLSSDMLLFRPEWIADNLYREKPVKGRLTTIAAIDFAYTKRTAQKSNPDWSVCIVADVDMEGHAWLTDIVRMRESFPVFRETIVPLLVSRGVTRAYAEANGPQAGVADALAECCPVPIVPLPRHTDPIVRATQEQAFVAQGRLHLPGQGGQAREDFAPLVEEMLTFPASAYDDCVSVMLDICHAARTGDGQRRSSSPITTPGIGTAFPISTASGWR